MKPNIRSILLAAALGLWASAATAHHIAGTVQCTDTTPPTILPGVTVHVQGTQTTLTGTTDAAGQFFIGLPTITDTYIVTITPPAGLTVTSPVGGQYSVPIFANGVGGPDHFDGANFGLTGCGTPPQLGRIGDTVYCDGNANGVQDAGEPGIPGVKVTLLCKDANGNTIASAMAVTDASGHYLFIDVPAGACEVTVDTSSVTGDCNVPVCATKVTVNLAPGQIYLDADFCFTVTPPQLGRIGDTVYCDGNGNGIQDAGEPGIPGVKVTLLCKDANGNTIASAMAVTDANGKYLFIDVPAGACEVTVDTTSVTGDCNVPVCATKVTVNLAPGQIYLDADFCFTNPPSGPGTGTPGYWINHPEAWPVDSITIGGIVYTKAQAIAIMKLPVSKDKRLTMFPSLVSAKLNVLIGNESSCVDATIAAADAWWATYNGAAVKASSAAWKAGEPLYITLDNYNNGRLCAPHRD